MVLCGWTEAGVYPDWNNSVFRAQYELVTLHASVTKRFNKKMAKGRKEGFVYGSHFEVSLHHSKKDRLAYGEYTAEEASVNCSL